jgi:hypothetical protein
VPLPLLQAGKIAGNLLPGGRDLHDARVYLPRGSRKLIDVLLWHGEKLRFGSGSAEGCR